MRKFWAYGLGILASLSILSGMLFIGKEATAEEPPAVTATEVPGEATPEPDLVKISDSKLKVVIGKKAGLSLEGEVEGIVTWSTDNKRIATVSETGMVTGVREGYAVITAKCSGKSYTCDVTVKTNLSSKYQKFMKKLAKACEDAYEKEDPHEIENCKTLSELIVKEKVKTILNNYKKDKRVIYYTDDRKKFGVMLYIDHVGNYYVYYGHIKDGIRNGDGIYFYYPKADKKADKRYILMRAVSKNDYANGDCIYIHQFLYGNKARYIYQQPAKKGRLHGSGTLELTKLKDVNEKYIKYEIKFKNGKPLRAKKPTTKAWEKFFKKQGGYKKFLKKVEGKKWILAGYAKNPRLGWALSSKEPTWGAW